MPEPGPHVVVGGAAVAVLAAGSGSRVGAGVNKVLLPVGDRPMVAWSVATALGTPGVDVVVVVVRPGELDVVTTALREAGIADPRLRFAEGGASRHESEWCALRALAEEIESGAIDVVAIHDAARPHASATLLATILAVARERGGAVPAIDLVDVVHRAEGHSAERMVAVQTPQAFRAGPLVAAYRRAAADGFAGTDTAACVERYEPGLTVIAVPGEPGNLKVTFADDLTSAESS